MSRAGDSWGRWLVEVLLFAAAYAGVGWLSLALTPAHDSSAAVWPSAGLALGVLWHRGLDRWPAIPLAVLFLQASAPAVAAWGIALGNTLEAVLVVATLMRVGFDPGFGRVQDVGAFALFGVIGGPVISATLGVASLVAAGVLPAEHSPEVWMTWWVGNASGVLVVAPLVLLAGTAPPANLRERRSEAIFLFVVILGSGALAFCTPLFSRVTPVGFLHFPLVAWAAVRFGPHGATAASATTCVLALVGTAAGHGPFSVEPLSAALTLVQAYTSVVGVSGLVAGAAVAEQTRTASALQTSEGRFRAMFEQGFDGVILHDQTGKILEVNPRACLELGSTASRLVGENVLERCEPALRQSWRELLDPKDVGAPQVIEGELRRDDRSLVPVEVRVGVADVRGERILVALLRDVSARQESERERARLAEQLRQAQKMEAIGTLAGGIAHDFNNLLTGIVGNIELAQMGLAETHPATARLRKAVGAAELAARVVSQLLSFSRRQRVRVGPARTEVEETVRNAMDLVSRVIDPRIRVNIDVDPDTASIATPSDELHQVLINLSVNARDAMPDGGTLSVRATRLLLEDNARHPSARAGDFVAIEVEDTGTGMSPETVARLFEPFFTTKGVGRGTGLGLAVVYGIVRQYGGWIEVKSTPGEGSCFTVILPRVLVPASLSTMDPCTPVLPRGFGTVLVADDTPLARGVARGILENAGFSVEEAGDGIEALQRCAGQSYVLVVLDMSMPRMSGRDALAQLKRTHPQLPVVLASGYDLEGGVGTIEGWGAAGFVPKPYTSSALLGAVHAALQAAERAEARRRSSNP